MFRPLFLILLLAWHPSGLADEMPEGRIKSAYVLNFAKFAIWPATMAWPGDRLNLCVVGSNVLGGALDELEGRQAGEHELHVLRRSEADLGSCQIVFIGESEQHRFGAVVKSLADKPVLTISDIDDFAEHGGCIGLRYHDNKIVFEVNLTSTQRSGLRLPSQVLNLASYVYGK